MRKKIFYNECKSLLKQVRASKRYKKEFDFISKCIKLYKKDKKCAKELETHAEELIEILHNDYYAFLQEDAIIPCVYDLEKRIKRILKNARIDIFENSETTERIRERKHLDKITDEEVR